jgi:toxin FitB
VEILPVNKQIARRAGALRGQFQSNGIVRTQADLLIAATASEHGFTVVTRNIKDFEGCGVAVLNPFSVSGV